MSSICMYISPGAEQEPLYFQPSPVLRRVERNGAANATGKYICVCMIKSNAYLGATSMCKFFGLAGKSCLDGAHNPNWTVFITYFEEKYLDSPWFK